jgi:hypothetical protein
MLQLIINKKYLAKLFNMFHQKIFSFPVNKSIK